MRRYGVQGPGDRWTTTTNLATKKDHERASSDYGKEYGSF
jgi:hypothetical protein